MQFKKVRKDILRRAGAELMAGMLAFSMICGGTTAGVMMEPVTTVLADEEKTIIELNASTLPEGEIKMETVFGDFTLIASSSRTYVVDANNKKSADGTLNFTRRLKSGGATEDNNRTINFETNTC